MAVTGKGKIRHLRLRILQKESRAAGEILPELHSLSHETRFTVVNANISFVTR